MTKKSDNRRLRLAKTTVRNLTRESLENVAGGKNELNTQAGETVCHGNCGDTTGPPTLWYNGCAYTNDCQSQPPFCG
jgi:hypothetical protein